MLGGETGPDAVVCTVHSEASPLAGRVEVVYLDQSDLAINVDVKWNGSEWELASPDGGHADRYERLNDRVAVLRSGRRLDDGASGLE